MKKIKNKLLIFILVLFCISTVRIEFQNDTFFSIAIGKQIMNTGIDMCEHLTWHNNLMYTYSHWLFDIINLFLYNFAGFKAIYVMILIFTTLIGITLFTVQKKLNNNSYVVPFLMTLLVINLGKNFFTARAQIVSYLLFILEIYFIEKLLNNKNKKYILGLIIIPIIIANIHAAIWPLYFVFYLPYFAESFFNYFNKTKIRDLAIKRLNKKLEKEKDISKKEKILRKINNIIRENEKHNKTKNNDIKKVYISKRKYIKTLIIVFVIALFTGLLTPIHDTPYTYIFKTMGGLSTQFISELKPITLIKDVEFLIYLIMFGILIAIPKTKINLADCFMISGLLLMSIISRRSIAYLLFIGCIPLTRTILNYLNNFKNNILDKAYEQLMSIKFIKIFIICYSLIITICIFSINFSTKKFINESSYPVKACNYILRHIDIDNMKIFNEFDYGSYLEFKGVPTFIDSRSEIYTKEYNDTTILQDMININYGYKSYHEIFEKYEITHVLVKKTSIISKYIIYDDNYKPLYEDDNFIFYERI